jgi:hypothetical protein
MSDQSTSADSPSKGDNRLDREFRQSYFKQLVGQFNTLGDAVKNPEARKLGEQIAAQKPESVDWDDIYQLELAIIKLEPEANLRRRAWALRSEYKKIAPKDYEQYDNDKSKPPDAETSDIELLRADLVRVQEELNWHYTVLWVQESFRSLLLTRTTKRTGLYILSYILVGLAVCLGTFLSGTFLPDLTRGNVDTSMHDGTTNAAPSGTRGAGDTNAATSVLVGSQWGTNRVIGATNDVNSTAHLQDASVDQGKTISWQRGRDALTKMFPVFGTYWLVVFFGTLGALISMLRRIQGMSLDGNSDMNLVQLERSSTSIYYSPLLGAVFALLLLFLFMSGLVSGSLFPSSSHYGDHTFLGCVPSGCVDLAKLVIWSFIAGFAETLVPDALDKLQSESTSDKSGTSKRPTAE